MEQENQEQRIKELLLLQRVTQKINSILDIDKLLEEIVGDVLETFGYVRSGILLKDNETDDLVIAAVRGWTVNFHVKGDRFKIGKFGMVGHAAKTGETLYAPDVKLNPYYEISEESTNSEVDIPLKIHGELIGILNVQHHKTHAFSPERIQMLETLAGYISIAIENARSFRKEYLEKKRMLDELNDARRIQLNLFPKEAPVVQGFKITGMCLPCLEVGGDWYDFIQFKDERIGIVLADVSGKGTGAALLMSSTRSILRLVAASENSPKTVLEKVNNILLSDFSINNKFVTMIYAVLDPKENSIVLANAGHLYPFFNNASENLFLETSTGLPLGVAENPYSEVKINFTPGSRLILYTDGVTEAMNPLMEEYGNERLKKHFSNSSVSTKSIVDDINLFANGHPRSDDVTIVMIETHPPPAPP